MPLFDIYEKLKNEISDFYYEFKEVVLTPIFNLISIFIFYLFLANFLLFMWKVRNILVLIVEIFENPVVKLMTVIIILLSLFYQVNKLLKKKQRN